MERRRTLAQYRLIDLMLFAVLLNVWEAVNLLAATKWFPGQPFTVSPAAAMVAIVLMRWGVYGGAHAVWAGLVYCALSGAAAAQFLIYCLGNAFALFALIPRRVFGPARIRNDALWSVLFGAGVQLLMQAGRAVVALALGARPWECLGFFTTDALSVLFTGVIIWIVRRLDGVFEDQTDYLRRIAREQAADDWEGR